MLLASARGQDFIFGVSYAPPTESFLLNQFPHCERKLAYTRHRSPSNLNL